MARKLRQFSSFREAEEADRDYYRSLSPGERLELLLELINTYQEDQGASTERLERVYRDTQLARS